MDFIKWTTIIYNYKYINNLVLAFYLALFHLHNLINRILKDKMKEEIAKTNNYLSVQLLDHFLEKQSK